MAVNPDEAKDSVVTARRQFHPAKTRIAIALAGTVMLCSGWVAANPLGAGPDESEHYTRVLGVAYGDFFGLPSSADGYARVRPGSLPDKNVRAFRFPDEAAYDPPACFQFHPQLSAACPPRTVGDAEHRSYVGSYPVAPYVVPGLLTRALGGGKAGMVGARVAGAAVNMAFIAVAFIAGMVLLGNRLLTILALIAALTPMVLFNASVLGSSGLESVTALATIMSAFAIVETGRRWAWVSFWISAVALAWSRPTGIAWLGIAVGTVVALRGLPLRPRTPTRYILIAIGSLACASAVAWNLFAYAPPIDDADWSRAVQRTLGDLRHLWAQIVGYFGWLDTLLPASLRYAFALGSGALLAWAGARASFRETLVLALQGLFVGALAILIGAVNHAVSTFPLYGRYVLPGYVLLPVTWAVVAAKGSWPRWAPANVGTLVSAPLLLAVHFAAWWLNARRYAVGTEGPILFMTHALWRPAGGWILWSSVVFLGLLALTVAAVAPSMTETESASAGSQPHGGTAEPSRSGTG